MADDKFNRRLVDVILVLATAPALAVGVAKYSFDFDAVRYVALSLGGSVNQAWIYFWYYVLFLLFGWVLFVALLLWRER
jgi:hypothetical protein